jgi:hypothetical protein
MNDSRRYAWVRQTTMHNFMSTTLKCLLSSNSHGVKVQCGPLGQQQQ